VGVHDNIIEASLTALVDSMEFCLLQRDNSHSKPRPKLARHS
jgi:hypothetical protein